MAKGVRLLPFLLRSISIALFFSFSLSLSVLHQSSSFLFRFEHYFPFTIYSRPCFSRIIFSSLFDIALALFKDKFDVSVARARESFPSLPSLLLIVLSHFLSLLPPLRHSSPSPRR